MDLDFFNRIDKEREYKNYLVFHIEHVEDAYNRLIKPLKGTISKEFDVAIDLCGQYVPLHDLSKFSKEEFDSYRLHFYPTDYEKKNHVEGPHDFDAAWEHHHLFNSHHPYHWVKDGDPVNMPLHFILEMICDWDAVSQWYDSSIVDFYDHKAQDEKKAFTPKTRETVDFLIDLLFRKTGNKF